MRIQSHIDPFSFLFFLLATAFVCVRLQFIIIFALSIELILYKLLTLLLKWLNMK